MAKLRFNSQLSADDDSSCCEYKHTINISGTDPEQGNVPFSLGKPVDLKPPPVLAALAILFFDQPIRASIASNTPNVPPLTGTPLYLATQRLRI